MSHDVTLTLRATLQPEAAKALLAFCEDWAFIRILPALPATALLREARTELEAAFADVAHDPRLHAALRRHRLDVTSTVHHGPGPFDFLLDVFLPATLVALERGHLRYEGARTRTALTFDAATRRLLRHDEPMRASTRAPSNPEDTRLRANARWLARLGDMPAARWRKALAWWLAFVADLPRQQAAFSAAAPHEPIGRWEDLQDFYCTELALADGLGPAERNGYLSAAQAKALRPLDRDFRAFLPWDDGTGLAVLRSAEWAGIARQAELLRGVLAEAA